MNNEHDDYICVIFTTIMVILALFALLLKWSTINALSKSNQEIEETAEEAAIIQQFEQLQYKVKCEKVENGTCLEYSVYRVFKE